MTAQLLSFSLHYILCVFLSLILTAQLRSYCIVVFIIAVSFTVEITLRVSVYTATVRNTLHYTFLYTTVTINFTAVITLRYIVIYFTELTCIEFHAEEPVGLPLLAVVWKVWPMA